MTTTLPITKDTYVSDILEAYGDIAEVMEALGVRRAGALFLRKTLGKVLTVERAAKVHGVPLDEFLVMVQRATGQGQPANSNPRH
jgi:hypothetical protein